MTLYQLLELLVSILGLLVLFRSASLVTGQIGEMSKQVEEMRNALYESTVDSIQNGFIEISRVFLAYPQLRPIFYASEAPNRVRLTSEDKLRANALAELTLDTFASVIEHGEDVHKLWMTYIYGAFTESRFLVKYLYDHKDWYHKELLDIASQATTNVLKLQRGLRGSKTIL